ALLVVPFGPLLAWKRGDLAAVVQRLMVAAIVGVVGIALVFVFAGAKGIVAPFAIGLAVFVIAGAITDIFERSGFPQVPMKTLRTRLAGLPRSIYGTALAHLGLGVTLLGIVCESNWSSERIASMRSRDAVSIGQYDFTFEELIQRQGPNYHEL